jgi:uncharacterized protein (DUF1778 family)
MKNSTIQLRVSLEHKARIKKAADYENLSVSEYIIKMVDSDLKVFEDVIENKTQIDIEKL